MWYLSNKADIFKKKEKKEEEEGGGTDGEEEEDEGIQNKERTGMFIHILSSTL